MSAKQNPENAETKATETTPMNPNGDGCGALTTVPSIVIEEDHGNGDDPPPYSVIVPPNHVGWPFDFSTSIPYTACAPCGSDTQLAPFQPALCTSEESPSSQHTSIMMPLMHCQFFKFGSHRSLFSHRQCSFTDAGPVTKDTGGKSRRYGALLAAATVIVFLMALSLLVRFIVEGKFWRG